MKLKSGIKKGLAIFTIYIVVTGCLLMSAERIERLEKEDFRNTNTSVILGIQK